MTAEQYYAVTVEGDRKQLVEGAIVMYDERPFRHALLQSRILYAIAMWIEERGKGLVLPPIDVRLSEHDVYGPDVVWINDMKPPTDENDRLLGVPELCVEVRESSTWRYDLGPKKRGYEGGGVAELWLVDDEEERVLVFRRSRPNSPSFDVEFELEVEDDLVSPQLPDFALWLEDLFRR